MADHPPHHLPRQDAAATHGQSGEISRRSLLRTGAAVGAGLGALAVADSAAASPEADAEAPPGTLVLATGGRTDYRIYLGADEGPIVRQAASELASYLRAITSAHFTVTASDEPPRSGRLLVVGRKNPLAGKLGIDHGKLSDDGFAMRTFPSGDGRADSVLITGASDRGTLYGVYWLLDRLCGVRWFSPDYEVVPEKRELLIEAAEVNRDRVPKFRFREVFACDGFAPRYRQHNLLNGSSHLVRDLPSPPEVDTWSEYWPYDTHNFHQIVPNQDLWAGGQLKAMEPATRQIAAEELTRRIRAKVAAGEDASYGFGQMDWGWTPDPASKAFADAHGGALSAPIIDLVNDVASRVRQQISNARISTLAYLFSFNAPTGMTVNDNVVLTVAPIWADFAHPLISAGNQDIGRNIDAWSDLTGEIVVWTYNTNFHNYLQPFPNYRVMCESLKQLAARGIQGYFGQAAWDMGGGAELAHLRMWVLSRLLWDPDLDPDALMREFAHGFYGAGGRYVWDYMKLLMKALADTGAKLPCYIGTPVVPYLDFATVRRADDLLAAAEAAVRRNPAQLKHVQIARIGIDLVILLRRNAFIREAEKQGVEWDLDIERRIARFNAAVEASGMTSFREGLGNPAVGDLAWLRAYVSITPQPAAPPDAVVGLPDSDWVDYQELDFTLHPPVTTLVEDPNASSNYCVRMPGDVPDWGVQLNLGLLPETGSWKLYAVVRADTGTAAPEATAMVMGVYPPFSNVMNIPVSTLADGEYHVVEMPGTYQHNFDLTLWISPPDSAAIANVYVDRFYAVKA